MAESRSGLQLQGQDLEWREIQLKHAVMDGDLFALSFQEIA
jgi:hypothetical protein